MYKTILTYLPSPQSAPVLTEVAASLAEKCGAYLIGAHNSARLSLYGGIPADYLAQFNQQQRDDAAAIRESFEQIASERSLPHEWRHKAMKDTDAFDDIVTQGRAADLIVAGGRGQEDPLGEWYDLPIRLVMETGRPVLLVPVDGQFSVIGERVTVAWNHTRESARAAFDALPLLKLASSVRVLAVNSTNAGAGSPSEDLAATLSRHGVDAVASVATTTSRSDGEELLASLTGDGSDLLVMGCYGHSRLREMVLGGATRQVLATMRTPVLMSH
ncbi:MULTISPECIES: universal stress protein [Rhodomicrobium]|uniref:universal stress protein n=1 Tax=Rhodomicrobium TaxID=1068 RepID=UPI001482A24E|nr:MULTISPECIES: universal stress protein [Rhodomicrobium]